MWKCDKCGHETPTGVEHFCDARPLPDFPAGALIERTREGRERRTRVDAAIERGNLIAALEAALDELERKDASGAQALAALRKVHRNSDCNCGGGYVCDELRAIDALEEAITRKALGER